MRGRVEVVLTCGQCDAKSELFTPTSWSDYDEDAEASVFVVEPTDSNWSVEDDMVRCPVHTAERTAEREAAAQRSRIARREYQDRLDRQDYERLRRRFEAAEEMPPVGN